MPRRDLGDLGEPTDAPRRPGLRRGHSRIVGRRSRSALGAALEQLQPMLELRDPKLELRDDLAGCDAELGRRTRRGSCRSSPTRRASRRQLSNTSRDGGSNLVPLDAEARCEIVGQGVRATRRERERADPGEGQGLERPTIVSGRGHAVATRAVAGDAPVSRGLTCRRSSRPGTVAVRHPRLRRRRRHRLRRTLRRGDLLGLGRERAAHRRDADESAEVVAPALRNRARAP